MNINEFMHGYKNYPVLFVGTGISLRYLKNSYNWEGLLKKIAIEIFGDDEQYLNLKSKYMIDRDIIKYENIALDLEVIFNEHLKADRDGKFKNINDLFFSEMRRDHNLSRFKIYISQLLSKEDVREEKKDELDALKRARKNISSVITTNYDKFIENVFQFNPLIGNDILLSNPYGSVYKIHGCVTDPSKIIITQEDYSNFKDKFELIRAQLLSLFIHHPIIFIGYNVGDENVKEILKTIFTYVNPNSDIANRIRNNFLLVEYEQNSENINIREHEIELQNCSTIRINKIKTDNFTAVYDAISNLTLPVSTMDIRKVQSVVKEIYSGGKIKVNFTDDIDKLNNSDKIVVIGSVKTIQYLFQRPSDMMSNYFSIIEESNLELLKLIDKQNIASNQYFPIFGFSRVCSDISKKEQLKKQQTEKIENIISSMVEPSKKIHKHINDILKDSNISRSYKNGAIIWSIWKNKINLDEVESYLKDYKDKDKTEYKKLLCVYDYKKYSE